MRLTFKTRPYKEWDQWFAWHPVWVGDTWVWLETLERKFACVTECGIFYDYKLID